MRAAAPTITLARHHQLFAGVSTSADGTVITELPAAPGRGVKKTVPDRHRQAGSRRLECTLICDNLATHKTKAYNEVVRTNTPAFTCTHPDRFVSFFIF